MGPWDYAGNLMEIEMMWFLFGLFEIQLKMLRSTIWFGYSEMIQFIIIFFFHLFLQA